MIIREKHCLSGPLKSFTATPREVACHVTTRAYASPFLFLGAILLHAGFLPGKKFSVFSWIIGEKRLVISEKLRYLFLLLLF